MTGPLKLGEECSGHTYCTVSVRAKDCTVLPAALAVICTVEAPACVAGVLGATGALGVVLAVEEPPPPHPLTTNVPASNANATTK
jgi:hypothetical protein